MGWSTVRKGHTQTHTRTGAGVCGRKACLSDMSPSIWPSLFKRPPLFKMQHSGTSLVVQWLRLHTSNAEGPGSIPGKGTRSHMPQLRPSVAK